MIRQLDLFTPEQTMIVTVCCFFECDHACTGTSQQAHDAMEQHYREQHAEQVARIVGRYGKP